jgi:hypothetical protein
MNIKSTNKLSALICVICGLIFLPLTVTAQNRIVTTNVNEPGPASYHDVENYSALSVTGDYVIYTGANITLTATYNTNGAYWTNNAPGNGAYATNQSTLSLTDSAINTTGSHGRGIFLFESTGTLNNVNIDTKGAYGYGVSTYYSILALTGGTITTGSNNAHGISLNYNTVVTGSNVNIKTTGQDSHGVYAESSTLTLTGGTISTGAYGIYFTYDSTGTLTNVNIETTGQGSHGVYGDWSAILTFTGGTITTGSNNAHGIFFTDSSTGTLNNVNIKTAGQDSHGVYAESSTLTLTDSDISATGNGSNAIYLTGNSTGTASLNHNTLTGNITVEQSSTLNLTGSNGTVITGDVTALGYDFDSDSSVVVNNTLTDENTKLIGTLTHDTDSTLNLTLGDNAAFIGSGTVSNLVLGDNAILGYTDNGPLVIDGTLIIGNGIQIDFSDATLEDTHAYTILDWSNADLIGTVNVESFTAKNLTPDMTGTFTVENNQLTFNATAIPEPSVYLLLGIGLGILLLTARRRKVQS